MAVQEILPDDGLIKKDWSARLNFEGEVVIPYKKGAQLSVKLEGDSTVVVQYSFNGVAEAPVRKDLSTGALTIGTADGNDLKLSTGNDKISPQQGEIVLDDGKIYYTHKGELLQDLPKQNKFVPATQEPGGRESSFGVVASEGGAVAAGYTHENAKMENSTICNEDRALAHMYLPLSPLEAKRAMFELVSNDLGPLLTEGISGSTLSMALKNTLGTFTCTTLGDSPIYAIMRHDQTGDVVLNQVNIPHNPVGIFVRGHSEIVNDIAAGTSLHDAIKKYCDANGKDHTQYTEKSRENSPISKFLGSMGHKTPTKDKYEPDVITVDADRLKPEGYSCKGLLVCSDGVENGISHGMVQKALKDLYADNAQPTPEMISKTVVEVARNMSRDNVTAVMMPKDAAPGNLAVVADGNKNTLGVLLVSDVAIQKIRKKCVEKPTRGADKSSDIAPDRHG